MVMNTMKNGKSITLYLEMLTKEMKLIMMEIQLNLTKDTNKSKQDGNKDITEKLRKKDVHTWFNPHLEQEMTKS